MVKWKFVNQEEGENWEINKAWRNGKNAELRNAKSDNNFSRNTSILQQESRRKKH